MVSKTLIGIVAFLSLGAGPGRSLDQAPKKQPPSKRPPAPTQRLPECTCGSVDLAKDQVLAGGNRSAISYTSTVGRSGQANELPAFCYASAIMNGSPASIPDVDWNITGLYYRILASTPKPVCSTVVIPGAKGVDIGPINFGPGVQSIPSSAYRPQDGWTRRSAKLTPVGPDEAPILTAKLSVPYQGPNGQEIIGVNFSSTVVKAGADRVRYQYEVSSDSERRIRLYWNLPQTADLKAQFHDPEKPFPLSRAEYVKGVVVSTTQPAWALVPVVIADEQDVVWAYGVIPAYGGRTGTFSENKLFAKPAAPRVGLR
jgi:hypothetical protein